MIFPTRSLTSFCAQFCFGVKNRSQQAVTAFGTHGLWSAFAFRATNAWTVFVIVAVVPGDVNATAPPWSLRACVWNGVSAVGMA